MHFGAPGADAESPSAAVRNTSSLLAAVHIRCITMGRNPVTVPSDKYRLLMADG